MRSAAVRRGSGTRRRIGEVGAVTAELATALPAVVLVAGLAFGAVGAASQQVRLQDAAGDAARATARGDPVGAFAGGAGVVEAESDGVVCVTLSEPALAGLLMLEASSCADAAGR